MSPTKKFSPASALVKVPDHLADASPELVKFAAALSMCGRVGSGGDVPSNSRGHPPVGEPPGCSGLRCRSGAASPGTESR